MAEEVVLTVYLSNLDVKAPERVRHSLSHFLFNKTASSISENKKKQTKVMEFHDGKNLKNNCYKIRNEVLKLMKEGKKVTLNIYGHDLGGVAALFIAKLLGGFDDGLLIINLVVVDPASNHSEFVSTLDIYHLTFANQVLDLSECRNLKNVLALYTNQEVPKNARAPLIPIYPRSCQVEQDVIPGSQVESQWIRHEEKGVDKDNRPITHHVFSNTAFLAFSRVKDFLKNCGTHFKPFENIFLKKEATTDSRVPRQNRYEKEQVKAPFAYFRKNIYEREIKHELASQKREAQAYNYNEVSTRAYHSTIEYMNLDHKKLDQSVSVMPPKKVAKQNSIPESKREEDDNTDTDIGQNGEESQFRRPPLWTSRNKKNINYIDAKTMSLFYEFMTDVLAGMSARSQASLKGKIFLAYKHQIETRERIRKRGTRIKFFNSKDELKHALRNVIALALQKERYLSSFFSTTQSGEKILELLHSDKYAILRSLIPTSSKARVTRVSLNYRFIPDSLSDAVLGYKELRSIGYDDLRMFISGTSDEKNSKSPNYLLYLRNLQEDAKLDIFSNQVPHHLGAHQSYPDSFVKVFETGKTFQEIDSYTGKVKSDFNSQKNNYYGAALWLLADYSHSTFADNQGESKIAIILHGHWRRHHTDLIAEIIYGRDPSGRRLIYGLKQLESVVKEDEKGRSVESLLQEVERKLRAAEKPLNLYGDLVKRLRFIQEKCNLQTIDLEELCQYLSPENLKKLHEEDPAPKNTRSKRTRLC